MAVPLDLGELRLDLGGRPVQLDDQHRAGALGVAALHGRLGGLDRQRVHHLDRRGHDPGADDGRHRAAGLVGRREGREQGAHGLRRAGQPDRHLGGDAEGALRPDEGAEQVVARRVRRPAAEPHHVALRRDQLEPGDVVGGEAVLQAVRAAGVLRDVAADRADLLARRVGRVVVAVRRRRLAHLQVDDAGVEDRALVGRVDLADGAHLRQHDQHAVGVRQRAAGQPGARAAGDERHPGVVAGPHRRGDLPGAAGEDHDRGRHLVVREAVALVRPQLGPVGQHRGVTQLGAEPGTPMRSTMPPAAGHLATASARRPAGSGSPRSRRRAPCR